MSYRINKLLSLINHLSFLNQKLFFFHFYFKEEINVKKTGNLVTLNYNEKEWTNIQQAFATKSEKVKPTGAADYNGNIKLTPSSDTWVRTIKAQKGVLYRTQSS